MESRILVIGTTGTEGEDTDGQPAKFKISLQNWQQKDGTVATPFFTSAEEPMKMAGEGAESLSMPVKKIFETTKDYSINVLQTLFSFRS